MAILTPEELAGLRRVCAAEMPVINYTKARANAAIQAIEDWFEANRTAIVPTIDTATAPFTFTPAQKFVLMKYWLRQKFERGG